MKVVMHRAESFIFIGRSGCGKGTQAELLRKYLKERDPDRAVFYLETGEKFREFVRGEKYTHRLSHDVYMRAERQPDFLAVHLWGHILIDELAGGEHLIIDGTPRSVHEAEILDTAMKFYGYEKPFVIFIDVSRKWATERLRARGREDDVRAEEIKKRLDWFDADVMPAVSYFKRHPDYAFVAVNGEQTVAEVHQEMMRKMYGV